MARPNHRGWIVLDSYSSLDGLFCVDIFEHPQGGFGFEHLRSDPEDHGRWTAIGGFSSTRYDTKEAAITQAQTAIPWFTPT